MGRESAGDGTRQLGPESRGRRLGTRSWDKTVERVRTRDLGELAPGVGTRRVARVGTRELGELAPGVGTSESWDQRVGTGKNFDRRAGTRELGSGVGTGIRWRWDKTVRTGELGPKNWDRRVRTGELGPERWESWDKELRELGP